LLLFGHPEMRFRCSQTELGWFAKPSTPSRYGVRVRQDSRRPERQATIHDEERSGMRLKRNRQAAGEDPAEIQSKLSGLGYELIRVVSQPQQHARFGRRSWRQASIDTALFEYGNLDADADRECGVELNWPITVNGSERRQMGGLIPPPTRHEPSDSWLMISVDRLFWGTNKGVVQVAPKSYRAAKPSCGLRMTFGFRFICGPFGTSDFATRT